MRRLRKRWILLLVMLVTAVLTMAFALPDGAIAAEATDVLPAPATIRDNVLQDPFGSSLALLMLVGMIGIGALTVLRLQQVWAAPFLPVWWLLPLLALLGVAVSIYLTMAGAATPCVLNDCVVLQRAELFGMVPPGPLSVVGYLAILGTWLVVQYGGERWASPGVLLLLLLTAGGFAFAIYLVVLEPFVVGAICGWCLLSAGVMTLLFWGSAESYRTIRQGEIWWEQLYGE